MKLPEKSPTSNQSLSAVKFKFYRFFEGVLALGVGENSKELRRSFWLTVMSVELKYTGLKLMELVTDDAHKTIPGLVTMTARVKQKRKLAICIRSDDTDLLTPRRVYEVLPDEKAAKSNYIRVIDNEGEDYLYPAAYFIFVDFPPAVRDALLQAS